MIKLIIILSSLILLSCNTSKNVCDAYHTGNPNNGKKPYYLRKK